MKAAIPVLSLGLLCIAGCIPDTITWISPPVPWTVTEVIIIRHTCGADAQVIITDPARITSIVTMSQPVLPVAPCSGIPEYCVVLKDQWGNTVRTAEVLPCPPPRPECAAFRAYLMQLFPPPAAPVPDGTRYETVPAY